MKAIPRANFRYIIMKSLDKIAHYDRIFLTPTLYYIQDARENIKWTITTDKKQISDYSCQMAYYSFSGRRYEAWFTREVPVTEGPYKFRGLPGLVVAIRDDKKEYVFELKKLVKPKQNTLITYPDKFISTNREEFKKGHDKYIQSLPQTISAIKGRSSEQNQETVRAIKLKIDEINNSLEIE